MPEALYYLRNVTLSVTSVNKELAVILINLHHYDGSQALFLSSPLFFLIFCNWFSYRFNFLSKLLVCIQRNGSWSSSIRLMTPQILRITAIRALLILRLASKSEVSSITSGMVMHLRRAHQQKVFLSVSSSYTLLLPTGALDLSGRSPNWQAILHSPPTSWSHRFQSSASSFAFPEDWCHYQQELPE